MIDGKQEAGKMMRNERQKTALSIDHLIYTHKYSTCRSFLIIDKFKKLHFQAKVEDHDEEVRHKLAQNFDEEP